MSSRFQGTHEQFVETILGPVFVEEIEDAFARCPDPIPPGVGVIPRARIRSTLEHLYQEKGWLGKKAYVPPPGWARIDEKAEVEGITISWLYEVIGDGSLKNCKKGPEMVNGGIREVWRFDLEEAKALRAERNKKRRRMDTDKGPAPDRIEVGDWIYVRAGSFEEGIRARLGHAHRKKMVRSFVAQYERHALYVEKGDAKREAKMFLARRARKSLSDVKKKEVVQMIKKLGPIHIQAIRIAMGMKDQKLRSLLAKFVDQGKIVRTQPGWYDVAMTRQYQEPVIVDDWKLPSGAFGESCGPT